MKISFPKYGIDELLTQRRLAICIISFVALAVFASALGSYLLGNKFWLLMIAVLGIAGILLCLGAAAATRPNSKEINEAPSLPIEENAPQITSQWDYRPREARRARAALDAPSTETSDLRSPDPFVADNNVWCNDGSDEGATPAFISDPPHAEEPIPKALSQTKDSVGAAPIVDNEASEVRLKSNRQSNRRR